MNEVVTRTLSGIVYIALLIGAILFSEYTFQTLFSVFLLIAVYEFCKLYTINKIIGFTIAIAISCFMYFVHNASLNISLLIGLPFSIFLIVDLLQNKPYKQPTHVQKYTHLIGYVVLPFLIILQLPYIGNVYTPFLLISIFIMIWCNDTFAYICGKLLGKHKLYEKISPKKTIEGFIGGVIFTQIAALIIYYNTQLNASLIFWLALAFIVSLMGTIGDLIESKYKRQAGVKDSGAIMPGHGGILDRLDSIIFAAPFLFLIYKLII